MIRLQDVLFIHNILLDKFGGEKGVRDKGSLESAIARPFATFENVDLYPEPADKAAAILESIIINHPFIDGNKRTGYVMMRLLLLENNVDIEAPESDKYDLVVGVANGEYRFDEIKKWLLSKIKG